MLLQIEKRHRHTDPKDGQMRPVSTDRQLPLNLEINFARHSMGDDPVVLDDTLGLIDPEQHDAT